MTETTGRVTKKPKPKKVATEPPTKTKAAPKKAAKRPTKFDAATAALAAAVANLQALAGGFAVPVPTTTVDPDPGQTWRPAIPVQMRMVVAIQRGSRDALELDTANYVRWLSHERCYFCNEVSDPSLAADGPWETVVLCPCISARLPATVVSRPQVLAREPVQAAPVRRWERSKRAKPVNQHVEGLAGWDEAYSAPDGGLAWLREKMETDEVGLGQLVYSNTCRCGAQFPVFAGMIRRAAIDHGLGPNRPYTESSKCLPCAQVAAAQRGESHGYRAHVSPAVVNLPPPKVVLATLGDDPENAATLALASEALAPAPKKTRKPKKQKKFRVTRGADDDGAEDGEHRDERRQEAAG